MSRHMGFLFEHIKENVFKINELNDTSISKFEEYQALDFIKKSIIPDALNSYNQYIGIHNFKPVTTKEILQNLKKTRVDFPDATPDQRGLSTQSGYDPMIEYKAVVNDEKWVFTILKSGKDGQCYVTWRHPYNFSGKWHKVKFS